MLMEVVLTLVVVAVVVEVQLGHTVGLAIMAASHLGLPQAVVAMITGRMFRAGHPSRVAVLKDSAVGRDSGLLSSSVVMTDNLATISEAAIDRVIGHLAMDAIDVALRATLALG